MNTKFIANMTRLYGLIVVLSNILAVVVATAVSMPVGDSDNMQLWSQFIDSLHVGTIVIVAAFSVPTVVCIRYAAKALQTEEQMLENIAEIPSVFSLSSVIGWNLYYFIEIPFVIYARVKLGIHIKDILLTSWTFSFFSGVTAYTISFLTIEILNRLVLLPKVFPDGHIKHKKKSVRPKFSHLIFFSFIVSSAFPTVLLLVNLISVQIENKLEMNKGIIFVACLLMVVSFSICIALSRIIVNPINKLTVAAGRIKDGDYKTKVDVVTNDELGVLADSFNDMAVSLAEKEFMRDTFGKVVDPEVRDYLMKKDISLGGETREVTVLFCDIRSFTSMSEKMAAADVVSLLNKYFTALGECITNHHGIINKYIGDAIMAIFGAPVEAENSALDAFQAALDMRKALVSVNREFARAGLPQLSFGIGIHTGPVFAGTIGAASRMEYTVIGDTVNTASRMESLCKTYKKDLLISEAAAKKIGEGLSGVGIGGDTQNGSGGFSLSFLDETEIRGKEEKMQLYTA